MKKTLFIIILSLFAFVDVDAQPGPGGGGGGVDPGAPIDGGLTILLIAGAVYGIKKYKE